VSGSGRVTLDNTMEERLRLLEDKVCDLWAFSELTQFAQRSDKTSSERTRTANSTHNLRLP